MKSRINNFWVYGNLLLNLFGLFLVFKIKVLVYSLMDMPFWGFTLLAWYILALFVFSVFIGSLLLTWRYIRTGKRTKRNVFIFFINATPLFLMGAGYFWLDGSESIETQTGSNGFSEETTNYNIKVTDTVKQTPISVDSVHRTR